MPNVSKAHSSARRGGTNWNASPPLHCVQYGLELDDWRQRRGNAIGRMVRAGATGATGVRDGDYGRPLKPPAWLAPLSCATA